MNNICLLCLKAARELSTFIEDKMYSREASSWSFVLLENKKVQDMDDFQN